LAIPILAGPGAISTVIVLSSQARNPAETFVVYGAIVVTGLISFVVLRLGEPLLRKLGKTGIRVMTRIMGLILAAIAVQFVLSGIQEAFGIEPTPATHLRKQRVRPSRLISPTACPILKPKQGSLDRSILTVGYCAIAIIPAIR
jgi:hypothetical protein